MKNIRIQNTGDNNSCQEKTRQIVVASGHPKDIDDAYH